ncbi:hypothetical protein RUM43_000207 [Polyplax serrata]|uniref:Uncharacterized protein n=1 Tax=Polyplax serrata TaxID=468196 RepID=A0AAN8SF85_POLSC
MNERKGSRDGRHSKTDVRNSRNVYKGFKEFIAESEHRVEEKSDQEKFNSNELSYVKTGSGQYNPCRGGGSTAVRLSGAGGNYFSDKKNFSSNVAEPKSNKNSTKDKFDLLFSSGTAETNVRKQQRHLPFRNSSKIVGDTKKNAIDSGHGSRNKVVGINSSEMTSRKVSSGLAKKKPSPIILPREQFVVLQERIKTEIENLKYLENSVSCEGADSTSSKNDVDNEENASDSSDVDELEEMGSDIQFLSSEERNRLLLKYSKKLEAKARRDVKDESKLLKTKVNTILSSEGSKSDAGILTIDLTKDLTPGDATQKTEAVQETDYPSLDLDYGSKIDWEDGKKVSDVKHSSGTSEKAVISLDIDESKLTFETTKKITDIKNRLSRSLSIGLSHKDTEKDMKDKSLKLIGDEGGKASTSAITEDAEELELASLRCTSERTEVIADRERRRKRRCADYPGLAFGFSIFSSDTMMKFNIIRNELHNILNTQLKRVCTNLISLFRVIAFFSFMAISFNYQREESHFGLLLISQRMKSFI